MLRMIALVLAFAVAGCQTTGPRSLTSQQQAVEAAEVKTCWEQWALWVPRTKCLNRVATRYIRPSFLYPDLFDEQLASYLAIAEKVDAGLITPTEGKAQTAKVNSDATTEEIMRVRMGAF